MPIVNVIITTYDDGSLERTKIAEIALASLVKYLLYPELKWILVDDSEESHTEHRDRLLKLLPDSTTLLLNKRGGVGKAKNTALKVAFEESPFVLMTEDDWALENPFNLIPHVETLQNHQDIGIIRLGYLGGDMTAKRYETSAFNSYWKLDRGSGVYVYSGQISLRHKRFYDVVGYHPEGVDPGNEEIDMCKRFNATEGAPDNVFPTEFGSILNAGPFKNIGFGYSTNTVGVG